MYPTREGQRVWWKYKAKASLDMIAIGFTGTAAAPSSLVLAFPGVVDEDGPAGHGRFDDGAEQDRREADHPAAAPNWCNVRTHLRMGILRADHGDGDRAVRGRG